MFTAFAESWRKQWQERVECYSVREQGFVAAIEIAAGNGRCIERKAHVGEAGANKLCVHSRVVGKGGADKNVIVIKLVGECMLNFEALNSGSELPKGGGIFKTHTQGRDRVADVASNGGREGEVEACHQKKGTRSSFSPRREVGDVSQG
jgi:hypothetical protein